MTKKSVARFLFYGGLLLAYLPPVLVPRTLSLAPFGCTALGLLVAVAAATAFAFGTSHRRIAGTGVGYAYGGLAAAGLLVFVYTALQQAGDYVDFLGRRARLEALVLARSHPAAQGEGPGRARAFAGPIGPLAGAPAGTADVPLGQLSDVQLFPTGGQASFHQWGYAYSPTGEKPYPGAEQYTYWHRMEGHWYRWVKSDE